LPDLFRLLTGSKESLHTSSQSQLDQSGMGDSGESEALWTIKLNEDWQEDREKVPTQIRLRMELVLLALEEVQTEKERLQEKCMSVEELEKVFDAMNKA
jgi:hypothetical protein